MENGHVISMIRGYFIEKKKKRKNEILYSYIYETFRLSFLSLWYMHLK